MALYAAIALAVGPCSSSGETLERAGHRRRLGADPDPRGAGPAGQAAGPVILREPFQKRSWAELGYFLASSALAVRGGVRPRVLGFAGLVLTVVFVGVLHPGRRPAGSPGASAAGSGRSPGGRWARRSPSPSRSARRPASSGGCGPPWATGPPGGRWLYFVAKVPLTLFGVWFALSVWLEAFLGIASPFTGGGATSTVRPLRPRRAGLHNGGPTGSGAPTSGSFADRRPVPLRGPVDHAAGRLPRPAADAPPARARRRGVPGEEPRGVEVEDPRRRHRDPPAHRAQPARRHPGPVGGPGHAAGQAKEQARRPSTSTPTRPPTSTPSGAWSTRRTAGAKEAITDLRDLARGIHPPALDTGLENALATLAARSPVPDRGPRRRSSARPSPAIEAICYFCAAELLANVAQHAQASRAHLSCAQHGPWLRIVVRDDGRGGAAVNRIGSSSSGLAGLADRVGAVDGHLSIASPPGGPTVVTVDLPTHA